MLGKGTLPLGVYPEPPPDDTMPPLSYVEIPEDAGPFRLAEYGKGLRAITRARDWFGDLIP